MRVLFVPLLLVLAGCVTPPYGNGEGCWRYGVPEKGNTGPMSSTPAEDVPVVTLRYDELLQACGLPPEKVSWHTRNQLTIRACYNPLTDTIYNHNRNLGNYFIDHERCHIKLGREHNSCNTKGYGIGSNESACNWDKE